MPVSKSHVGSHINSNVVHRIEMDELIKCAERMVAQSQANVNVLANIPGAAGSLTPYQRELLGLSRRAKQDSTITQAVADAATMGGPDKKFRVFQLGPSNIFNPVSMLESAPLVRNGEAIGDWKELLKESIDREVELSHSPYDIIMRVFETWHTDYMPNLDCIRGTATSNIPGMYIRNPIWTISSITHHLYYNISSRKFAELTDDQITANIADATRAKLRHPEYTPSVTDVNLIRRRFHPYSRKSSSKRSQEDPAAY